MLNGWDADTDRDALDPWREPGALAAALADVALGKGGAEHPGLDPDVLAAALRLLPLALLLWAGLVGGLIWAIWVVLQ